MPQSKVEPYSSVSTRWGKGRGATGRLLPVSKKPRSSLPLRSSTPREQLLPEEDLTRPTAGSGAGSSLVPTLPWPRGAERPLWAPHRTLQFPQPKRGALLSAGIWIVVKRLHCLVHELQCRLGSFHGGVGGVGSDGSHSSPRLLRCSAFPLPYCVGHSRSPTGAISSLAVTRAEGFPVEIAPRKQSLGRIPVPGLFFQILPLDSPLLSPEAGARLFTHDWPQKSVPAPHKPRSVSKPR